MLKPNAVPTLFEDRKPEKPARKPPMEREPPVVQSSTSSKPADEVICKLDHCYAGHPADSMDLDAADSNNFGTTNSKDVIDADSNDPVEASLVSLWNQLLDKTFEHIGSPMFHEEVDESEEAPQSADGFVPVVDMDKDQIIADLLRKNQQQAERIAML